MALGVVLLLALLVQTVVAPLFSVGGWPPDVVLATVVAFALVDGSETGARFGFVAGLGSDLLSGSNHLVGLMALVFLVVGDAVGRLRPYVSGSERGAGLVLGALGGAVSFGLFTGMSLLLDIRGFGIGFVLQGMAATALWSGILAPLLTLPARAVSRRFTRTDTPVTGPPAAGRGW